MKRTTHVYLRLVLAQPLRVFSMSSWLQITSTAVKDSFLGFFLSSFNLFFRLLTNLSQFSFLLLLFTTIISNFTSLKLSAQFCVHSSKSNSNCRLCLYFDSEQSNILVLEQSPFDNLGIYLAYISFTSSLTFNFLSLNSVSFPANL